MRDGASLSCGTRECLGLRWEWRTGSEQGLVQSISRDDRPGIGSEIRRRTFPRIRIGCTLARYRRTRSCSDTSPPRGCRRATADDVVLALELLDGSLRKLAEVARRRICRKQILRHKELLELDDVKAAGAEREIARQIWTGCGRISCNRHHYSKKDHHFQKPTHGEIVAPFALRYG